MLAAGDAANAMKKFLDAAQLSSGDAENEIGKLYLFGNGVDQSSDEATYWFNRSAQNGNIRGMTNLGLMYFGDRGYRADFDKAAEWLGKAAEQGQPVAQWKLGTLYQVGQGVAQDAAKAAEWFAKSAEQGNAEAQNELGLSYLNGTGVPKDLEKALHLFTDAADQGQSMASYQIALYYEDGKGMKKDHVKAFQWYLKSAQDGNKDAQIFVGDRYIAGSKRAGVAQDVNTGIEWYKKAMVGREPRMVALIATRMLDNTSPMFDPKTALALYTESAKAGDAVAQFHLANICRPGVTDLLYQDPTFSEKDPAKAVEFLQASAAQGFMPALSDLAEMYLAGDCVEKSPLNAYVFAVLAIERGAPWAEAERDKAAAELTPAQLEEAKAEIERRKANWK